MKLSTAASAVLGLAALQRQQPSGAAAAAAAAEADELPEPPRAGGVAADGRRYEDEVLDLLRMKPTSGGSAGLRGGGGGGAAAAAPPRRRRLPASVATDDGGGGGASLPGECLLLLESTLSSADERTIELDDRDGARDLELDGGGGGVGRGGSDGTAAASSADRWVCEARGGGGGGGDFAMLALEDESGDDAPIREYLSSHHVESGRFFLPVVDSEGAGAGGGGSDPSSGGRRVGGRLQVPGIAGGWHPNLIPAGGPGGDGGVGGGVSGGVGIGRGEGPGSSLVTPVGDPLNNGIGIGNGKGNAGGRGRRRRRLEGTSSRAEGARTVLAVRVSTAAGREPDATAAALSDGMFGTSGADPTFASQFAACSYGKLTLSPFVGAASTGVVLPDGDARGVYEVTAAEDDGGTTVEAVRDAAVARLESELGDLESQFDHVVLCLPPGLATESGAESWSGGAYSNHWLSYLNNDRCAHLSTLMNFVGRNFGLMPAGEGNAMYGDQTGHMGYTYPYEDIPAMCFNGAKSWQLGWYADKHATAVTEFAGKLIGVSDYETSAPPGFDGKVILKIDGPSDSGLTYYVAFNRATGINSWTQEGRDQVLVTAQGDDDRTSDLVAKLSAGGGYTIPGTSRRITVDAIATDGTSQPDHADVTLSTQCVSDSDCDDGSACNGAETCDVSSGLCEDGTPAVACGELWAGAPGGPYYPLDGNFFDLTATRRDVTVTNLVVHTYGGPGTIRVFALNGEGSADGKTGSALLWTEVATVSDVDTGPGTPQPLPEGEFEPVLIPAGTTKGFYVYNEGVGKMLSQEETGTPYVDTYAVSDALTMSLGQSKATLWLGSPYAGSYNFNGAIVYEEALEEEELPARFMSGEWGIGFRMQGGNYYERFDGGSELQFPYDASRLHAQITGAFAGDYAAFKPKWIVVNLSSGADGLQYTSPHPDLGTCDQTGFCQTPSGDDDSAYDNFYQLVSWLKANTDMKVIAYMASEGPAKLHHGETDAWDYDTTSMQSAAVEAWKAKVMDWYNATGVTSALLQRAYAEKIVGHYADRFRDLIDGYWFDHATDTACDRDLIERAIRAVGGHQSDAAVTFQGVQKSPLYNAHPGLEDFTGGHPNPVKLNRPYSCVNEEMVTSIEDGTDGDGYFPGGEDGRERSLGHMFIPTLYDSWNRVLRLPAWDTPKLQDRAVEWMSRVREAGGAWTWNAPMATNNIMNCVGNDLELVSTTDCVADDTAWGIIDEQHMDFMETIVKRVADVAMGAEAAPNETCSVPTPAPTDAPTVSDCADDLAWRHTTPTNKVKSCSGNWVKNGDRCRDAFGDDGVRACEACCVACGSVHKSCDHYGL